MLEEMENDNLQMMNNVVKILPKELAERPNYRYYLLKYKAYTFFMDQSKCKHLCKIFNDGFVAGLKEYYNDTHKYHHSLIIRKKVYPEYDGCGIHQGSKNDKTARKLQPKTTTTMEKGKLDDLKDDVPTLQGIITYTENITTSKKN